MIVVEGPDGAGKTTLIRDLCTNFPLTLAPRVVSKDTEAMVDLVEWVEEDNKKLNQGVIYDRHRLVSEWIYGPIMRGQPEPGFDDPVWLESQLRLFYAKKPLIIYCIPSLETVIHNVTDDAENSRVFRRIVAIWQGYVLRSSLDIACGRAYRYDYTKPSQLRMIMGIVNREEVFYG